jgi:hypothetical protein
MTMPTDQRATPRIPAKVPLVAEGRDIRHIPFREETHTVLVNEGGALIALAVELKLQDRVRLTNRETQTTAECRIAWRSSQPIQGRWSYGIALLGAPDNFWGLKQ